jgi:hypothetical protein
MSFTLYLNDFRLLSGEYSDHYLRVKSGTVIQNNLDLLDNKFTPSYFDSSAIVNLKGN